MVSEPQLVARAEFVDAQAEVAVIGDRKVAIGIDVTCFLNFGAQRGHVDDESRRPSWENPSALLPGPHVSVGVAVEDEGVAHCANRARFHPLHGANEVAPQVTIKAAALNYVNYLMAQNHRVGPGQVR